MACKLLAALLLPIVVLSGSVFAPTPGSVTFQGMQLYVDGAPFYIKGLCYSPVPIGESPQFYPFGDYFVSEYAYIWKRDLPLIKQMGVNTIRIYGWDTTHNVTHYEFLDEVHKHGLKILLTFYVGTKFDKPPVYINSPELKQVPITNFTREAALYGDHPAILFWSFGNELNGPWNGFLEQFNELGSCGWVPYNPACWNAETLSATCLAQNECLYRNFFGWINNASVQVRAATSRPVISGMADIDRITDKNSKQNVSKLQLYGQYAPDLAAWSFQLYRGASFGNYFKYYKRNLVEHPKPLIITEYGTDAYNDICGWPQNIDSMKTCRNLVGDNSGGGVSRAADGSFSGCSNTNLDCVKPGEEAQAEWDVALTQEILSHAVGTGGGGTSPTPVPTCTGPWDGFPDCAAKMQWLSQNWQNDPSYAAAGIDGSPCSIQKFLNEEGLYCPDPYSSGSSGEGITLGGFMMAWMDEFWKGNIVTEGHCNIPCDPTNVSACYAHTKDFEMGKSAGCTYHAHWDCPNKNPYYHGLCGYRLEGAPDFYINEEWFGLTMPEQCGKFVPTGAAYGVENPQKYGLDTVKVRGTMKAMQKIWAPQEWAKNIPFAPATCETMIPCWQCLRDHSTENAAFLGSCLTQCELTPLAPTPATVSSAPTPAAVANTTAPSAASTVAPTAAGNGTAPTAAPVYNKTEVTLKFTNITALDHEELILELAVFFQVDPPRFTVKKQRPAADGGFFVDLLISDGSPVTFNNIFDMLSSEVEFLKIDPERGCTLPPNECKKYTGDFQGKVLDTLDPQYPPTINGDAAAPTLPPSAPTKPPTSPTVPAPTSTPKMTKRLSLKLAGRTMKLPVDVEPEFEAGLSAFFGIDIVRVEYKQIRQLNEPVTAVMVDFILWEGNPTIDALYAKLVDELKAMRGSSNYGCSGAACTDFKSTLAKGPVFQYLSAYFTPELDRWYASEPAAEEESNTTTIILVVVAVLGGLVAASVGFVLWRRHQKAKDFDHQLLSYTDTGYVAQTVN